MHNYYRKTSYVCSFHINPFESAALWSIYAKSNQGIAIQSTFKRLCECFNDYKENEIFIGLIKYIDYTLEKMPIENNLLPPLFYKRKSFEHEKEIRAIILSPKQYLSEIPIKELLEKLPNGVYVPVNLDTLIEKIYIAPSTQPWVKSLIFSIIEKYGLNKDISQSYLDQNPVF